MIFVYSQSQSIKISSSWPSIHDNKPLARHVSPHPTPPCKLACSRRSVSKTKRESNRRYSSEGVINVRGWVGSRKERALPLLSRRLLFALAEHFQQLYWKQILQQLMDRLNKEQTPYLGWSNLIKINNFHT